ncbi:MAG: hypothetical protein ABW321_21360 [Polyangiales bacterium]
MTLSEKLLAAALSGAVLGAVGCASTSGQSQPTTPENAAGDKHGCKGEHGCSGEHSCGGKHGCKGEHAGDAPKPEGDAAAQSADSAGDKASCKGQGSCHS